MAGWKPERDVGARLAEWERALATDGTTLHAAAAAVLREFGGLHIGAVGPGRDLATSDLDLDPLLALGASDLWPGARDGGDRQAWCPLGEVHHGHGFLGMAASGEVALVMDEVYGRWTSFPQALEALLLGRRLT